MMKRFLASAAMALAISAVFAVDGVGGGFLGLSGIDWIAYVIVAGFQGMTEVVDITTLGQGGSDTRAVSRGAA